MGRFLIYFSYLGTRYSGLQIQRGVLVKKKPVKTVAGVLENVMKFLRPSNEIKITVSSRTDKGVHALKNSCHVDLVYPQEGKEYNADVITSVLNFHLKRYEEDIRVLQTRQVPMTFHARLRAVSRKYVYRMGHVLGSGVNSDLDSSDNSSETSFDAEIKKFISRTDKHIALPLGEPVAALDASKVKIYRSLDMGKLIRAAEMVSGIHSFLSFTSKRKEDADYLPHPVKMLAIGVKRGLPFGHQLQQRGLDVSENIEYWDIHIHSKSFMYRQVRRLVGAMVSVAKGIITLDDLRQILDNPGERLNFSHYLVAPETGLFLLDVAYNPQDLELDQAAESVSRPEQQLIKPALDETDITSQCVTGDGDIMEGDQDLDMSEEDDMSSDDDNISPQANKDLHSEHVKQNLCEENLTGQSVISKN